METKGLKAADKNLSIHTLPALYFLFFVLCCQQKLMNYDDVLSVEAS